MLGKLYANFHTLAFPFSILEGHPGSVGKSPKGKAGVGRGENQIFTREEPIMGHLGAHIWLQSLSFQLPQWNSIPTPSWAQEQLIRGIVYP